MNPVGPWLKLIEVTFVLCNPCFLQIQMYKKKKINKISGHTDTV